MGARLRLLALAAAASALVSACGSGGGGDGDKVASLSSPASAAQGQQSGDGKTDEDKAREFAACMREHGIDMPDPQTNGSGSGGVMMQFNGGDDATMKAADEACRHLLPNGGKPPKLDAAQLDKMREHAKCLRDHGLDVPDPDPNNPGISIKADGSDKEKVDAAMEACKSLMPGGGEVHTNGGGPDNGPATNSGPDSGGSTGGGK